MTVNMRNSGTSDFSSLHSAKSGMYYPVTVSIEGYNVVEMNLLFCEHFDLSPEHGTLDK